MTNKILFLVLFILMLVSCDQDYEVKDITENFQSICEKVEEGQIITLNDALQDTVGDKVYVFYPQSNLPSSIWEDEDEFLDYMKLSSNLENPILTSNSLATFLIIKNDVILNQYIVNCNEVAISPSWFSVLDCYLGGPVNDCFNSFDDAITCDTLRNLGFNVSIR